MKKKNLNSLALNKKSISNFNMPGIKGGTFISISCQPVGICAESDTCPSDGCPSDGCPSDACPSDACPSNGCPTISCQPVGICR